jgi:hypothetical protein
MVAPPNADGQAAMLLDLLGGRSSAPQHRSLLKRRENAA